MVHAANTFLLIYAALFPIIDPVGNVPFFVAATLGCTEAERRALAFEVARYGFFLLVGSLFFGANVLGFFGVSLPAVRVAGGLAVSAFGWRLLESGGSIDGGRNTRTRSNETGPPDAFYPLTMPLTVGPGSISVAITLGAERPLLRQDPLDLAFFVATALAAIGALSVTIYLCYRFAERTVAILGERGTNVMLRLAAFIMLCIGIQIIWSGVSAVLNR
ncbi:MAG TPA: MarC family protein [Acetobacteraceae bacterium]|nr:MarC family protein [Acetobacteraceae bacterium]